MTGRIILILLACASAAGCTEPAEREVLRVRIDAQAAVRELADDVEVLVETRTANGGWQTRATERFEPKTTHRWPLELRVERGDRRLSYQVTATARDDHKAIVAHARAIRDDESSDRRVILLVFEAACVRRTELCPNGHTCHRGECVDAHHEADPDSVSAPSNEPSAAADAGAGAAGPSVGSEGEPCDAEGAHACTDDASSRAPLVCESGAWKSATVCAEDQLCDTTPGPQRGTCRSIAAECRGRDADVEFCDRDVMRVCKDMFASEIRPCGDNMRCVAATKATCECAAGFVPAAGGCQRALDCTEANGGCGELTTCTMHGGAPTCSPCPPGYFGAGKTGCQPLLGGLTPSVGQLQPAFDPATHDYRVNVPLLAQRVTLTPNSSSDARIELNGEEVAKGAGWTTPTLPLGEYSVTLRLTSDAGETSDYDVVIERGGTQSAYLKASNTHSEDYFASSLAMSGNTLVVGALFDDGSIGSPETKGLTDSGAVFVFEQRGDAWEQQAYLKAGDAAAYDYFGNTVAIDGDTIVVGAIRDNVFRLSTVSDKPGAAYVFARNEGLWTQVAKLAPATGVPGDRLGFGVAIEDDTIVLGAPRDGRNGAAYVYSRIGGTWTEQQKLRPAALDGSFGSAVTVSNGVLVVGASDDSTEVSGGGAAYVFAKGGTFWTEQQRLTPSPSASGANFGYSLALEGDALLIGAPRVASIISLAQTTPGEVFAFRRSGAMWQQTARLRAMLPRMSDSFGSSIALTETAALIGACGDVSGATGVGADASRRDARYSGAAYLYAKEDADWKLSAYLKSAHVDTDDMFGFSAALSGETAVIGAVWESSNASGIDGNQDNNAMTHSGAAYVFR